MPLHKTFVDNQVPQLHILSKLRIVQSICFIANFALNYRPFLPNENNLRG